MKKKRKTKAKHVGYYGGVLEAKMQFGDGVTN